MSQTLDSRDLQERLDELEGLENILNEANEALSKFHNDTVVPESDADDRDEYDTALEELEQAVEDAEDDFGTSEKGELEELRDLADEVSEWEYGAILVHENYWVDYCKELCEDIGDIPKNLPAYIENNINWESVAQDLSADYSQYTYQGETYFARNC
jgi:uncharacterized protein YPO0396